jgi:hypothetical protein
MLEKAGECDRNAAGAKLSETQSAFRALAEQWRRLAVEIQQTELYLLQLQQHHECGQSAG